MKKQAMTMYSPMPEHLRAKAVARIVQSILENGWDETHAMYEGVLGWSGPMAPLNRPAFVSKYGPLATIALEKEAEAEIARRKDFWQNSKARGYEAIADSAEGNDPAAYDVGTFVWGVESGLKFDHEDVRQEIRYLVEDAAERVKNRKEERKPQLFKITRIEEVEDIEATATTLLRGWKPQPNEETGSGSDDVSEERVGKYFQNYSRLIEEEKRTFYTLAVLVRDGKGRWLLIDSQGYDYPRYIALPKSWRGMYEATVASVTADIEREKREAAEAAAKEEAEARAAYEARCAKWTRYMTPIPASIKRDKYGPSHEWRKYGKRNVLAMAKAAFPWVRFSVSYDKSWGAGYVLSWKNGPTKEEVAAATDFGLFEPWHDTFDGMTDYADIKAARFTDFSEKYGGVGNGVGLNREECETDKNGDPNAPVKVAAPRTTSLVVEVSENPERNGVEIRFASMPGEDVRNALKANGWRWSKFSKCWYHRATDEARAFAKQIAESLAA